MIRFPVYLGDDALDRFLEHCAERGYRSFLLAADENTWQVLGRRVAALLEEADLDVKTVVLSGEEVVADAHYLTEVMVASDPSERVFLAVGSGTITDITRLVSHRTGAVFISLPTAPSVDGFASIGAPVVLRGIKQTVLAHPPEALFGDLSVLAAAPAPMIAAGFGDLLGKITSVADWRLGALLYDEPYDDDIAERSLAAALRCADRAEEIGAGSPEAIRLLMEGLIESGLCMLDFGESRPASGAEHHASHFWEMKLLSEGRTGVLHGAKVGIATGMVAERYALLRTIDREEAALAVGIPVALLPARALIGLPGIGFARAGAAVFTLIFEAEEVVYANSGALLHCPSCRMDPQQAPKSDFFTVMRPDQRPALLKAIGQGMAPVRNVRKVPLAA